MSDNHSNKRMKSLFSFYKKVSDSPNSLPTPEMEIPPEMEMDNPPIIIDVPKGPSVKADPGKRQLICTFPVIEQDRIRREYLILGPCQPKLQNYPPTFDGRDNRRFQYKWFSLFTWLEYSESRDRVFCFPCFLFEKNPPKSPLFTTEGCCNWSRMLAGKRGICAQHVGGLNSSHQKNVQSWANLLRTFRHIDRVIDKLPPEIVTQNRLRLDILIRLVLTLSVSTTTTERAFSAMKIIKIRLRNKMEDGYLSGCMILHIEKEYVDDIDSEAVIDHFESIGDRRAQFK